MPKVLPYINAQVGVNNKKVGTNTLFSVANIAPRFLF